MLDFRVLLNQRLTAIKILVFICMFPFVEQLGMFLDLILGIFWVRMMAVFMNFCHD